MPVLLAFKERDGIVVLNDMLRVFADTVKSSTAATAEDSSKVKVAAFGLKKILDLYFILVNGKHIGDTHTYYNLQRQTDRSQFVQNIHSQITVEFRALILPVIMELWDSTFVERVPDQTVKRLVDILKIVALGEGELQSMPKDKVRIFCPHPVFQRT
jgi:E3 ubiquitin-protein ligase HUWE1